MSTITNRSSLSKAAAPKKKPTEWRTMVITLKGNLVQVDLDGERVSSFDPDAKDVPRQKEWYEPKRQSNLARHKIDFQDAKEIWHGNVLAVPSAQTQHGEQRSIAYGVVAGTPVDERTERVLAIVEKPSPQDAPSDLAAVHGYVLEPEVFEVLEHLRPGRNGEIWLTDAVSELARQGAAVWAVELQGVRYDTGDKLGYVKAFVDAALGRDDMAPLMKAHLKSLGWKAPGER